MLDRKGVIWNALGSAMYGVNSFIMLALVSRVGTVEQAGYFGIAFTTAQMLYFLGVFGVSHYQMTDYTETYSFSDYARLRIFSSTLMMLCCAATVFSLGFTGEKRSYTIALSILMLLNAGGDLYQCLFFQKNRLDLSGSALFFRTFWSLAAFSLALLISRNILLAVGLQILVNLGVTIYYALGVAPKFLTRGTAHRRFDSFSLGKACFPLLLSLLLMNLLLNIPKYGIEFFLDDTAQGYFSMIFVPVQVINLCAQFIFKPMLNSFSRSLQEKRIADFWRMLVKQIVMILGLTLLAALAAYLLGTQVLGFVYGWDLSDFKMPLTILMVGGGLFACSELLYLIMVMLRRQLMIFGIYVLCLGITVGMTASATISMGIMGAVIVFVASHLLLLVFYAVILVYSLKTVQKSS